MPIDGPCVMGIPGMEGGDAAAIPCRRSLSSARHRSRLGPQTGIFALRDGGANPPGVAVAKNGAVLGLEMEDTVAKFTPLDGQTRVEPSNKVALYSPRFCAVRQVVDVEIDQQQRRATGVNEPVKAIVPRTSEPVALSTLDLQPIRGIGTNPPNQLRSRLTYATDQTELLPRSFNFGFRGFENISIIRNGIYQGNDQPILARGSQAAIVWTRNEGVKVILDASAAAATIAGQKPQETITFGTSPNPRLRIVKVASTPVAEPGDEVSFTIRFDNVGNQPIGSVEIIDSLTTRLGIRRRQRPVQPQSPFQHAAQRGRFAGRPLPLGRSFADRQRRRRPLPLHRAIGALELTPSHRYNWVVEVALIEKARICRSQH